jgi:hypothetical protein
MVVPEGLGLAGIVWTMLLDQLDGIDIRVKVRLETKDIHVPNASRDRKLGRHEAALAVERDRDVIMRDLHLARPV